MFVKNTLVPITLALLAAASPVVQEAGPRISLHKRGELASEDGIFDHEKAIQHSVRIHNKYRQNMINLMNNEGPDALNEGAEIKPIKEYERLEKRQAEPLVDENNDLEWAGTMSIGGQSFLIDFDTGSSDLWVPSVNCTSSTCSKKAKYNQAKSKNGVMKSGRFSINYADGSTVSGPEWTDTVAVAGATATQQYFSPVTTLSNSFGNDPIDGLCGLAFPSISNLKQSPFFNTLFSQHAVPKNEFGFKLAKTNSELYLGGTDNAMYTGAIEYHSVTSSGFWQATGAKAVVNGKSVVTNFQTIIDSGTTLMYGPPADVATFYNSVPGSKVFDKKNGLYSFPCQSVPNVAFNWGGNNWAISPANFNLGLTASGSSQCVGALIGQDLGVGNGVWLLGDAFMKNVYTAFSFAQNSVGFATLR